METTLVEKVRDTAERVLASGAISPNGHGNVSLRVPGVSEMYFSSAPSLRNLRAEGVARVGLDGRLLEGELPPIQGAVVAMHTALYQRFPEVGCVLHTHPPYATGFAVANLPIRCWIEGLAMIGLSDGVPVAAYAPRGSEQAVANILSVAKEGVLAVLLAHHGVLVFHRTPELAVMVGGIVEEAAHAAVNAKRVGDALEIPVAMREAALQRAVAFERAGAKRV